MTPSAIFLRFGLAVWWMWLIAAWHSSFINIASLFSPEITSLLRVYIIWNCYFSFTHMCSTHTAAAVGIYRWGRCSAMLSFRIPSLLEDRSHTSWAPATAHTELSWQFFSLAYSTLVVDWEWGSEDETEYRDTHVPDRCGGPAQCPPDTHLRHPSISTQHSVFCYQSAAVHTICTHFPWPLLQRPAPLEDRFPDPLHASPKPATNPESQGNFVTRVLSSGTLFQITIMKLYKEKKMCETKASLVLGEWEWEQESESDYVIA